MGDLKDTVLEFVSDYKKYIFIGLGVIVIGFLLWAVLSEGQPGEKEKSGSREELDVSLDKAKELQEVFSEFSKLQVAPSNKLLAYEVDLYLKKPFLPKDELMRYVQDYVELLKYQTNDEKTDTYLLGVNIRIYDRESVYREGLQEHGKVTYMLRAEDEKKKKKEDKYLVNTDMRWEQTITQKGKPDYEKYVFDDNYRELRKVSGITPLSDEEFDFYLKLNKYSALGGGSTYSGIRLYLKWDLGRDMSKDGSILVTDEFEEFAKRVTELHGSPQYYTDIEELKKDMAVKNPRFLVFALTGEIIDDKVTAKRRLIKEDSEFYLSAYLEDAKEKLNEGIDDTSSQDALDMGELSDEDVKEIQKNPGTVGDKEDDTGLEGNGTGLEDGIEYEDDAGFILENEEYDMGEPMHKDDEEMEEPVEKE